MGRISRKKLVEDCFTEWKKYFSKLTIQQSFIDLALTVEADTFVEHTVLVDREIVIFGSTALS